VPSSFQVQPVASSGTIVSGLCLLYVLVEQDEIVEDAHHRALGDNGGFLMD